MLVFLKLGGSLITHKSQASTHRPEVLDRLSKEIASARQENPELRLVIGHGSGSFGHTAAARYQTQRGVRTPSEWLGFASVWYEAHRLNVLVVEALIRSGIPVIALPPSAATVSRRGHIETYAIETIEAALQAGLVPVINGDVTFDQALGGTILSTEELFAYLAIHLRPKRILLAGHEPGVWSDYPHNKTILPMITGEDLGEAAAFLHGSASTDVTGGMLQKVESMLALIKRVPELEILIFSGEKPGLVKEALSGASPGTLIRAESGMERLA